MKHDAMIKLFKQGIAELLGTMLLVLTVEVLVFGGKNYPSSFSGLFGPVLVGAVLAVLVSVLGGVSGAHFNPAISIGLFSIRKLRLDQLAVYGIAQIIGGLLALRIATGLLGSVELIPVFTNQYVWWGEIIGTFILAAAVTGVVLGKIPSAVGGVIIGIAVMVGASLSILSSGAILNPAIAISMQMYALPYLLAPVIGAVMAAFLIHWLYTDHTDSQEQ